MRLVFVLFFSISLYFVADAQNTETLELEKNEFPLSIALTNNAAQLPGTGKLGIINTPFHPGITLGTYKVWCEQPKHIWLQSFKFGYFYHHYSQHALSLYTEIVYSYSITPTFGFNLALGGGYLHAIKDVQVFELSDNGSYEKKKGIGNPQFAAGLQGGLFYSFSRAEKSTISIFLDYRFWVQAPFVKEYVPVLPYSTLQIGALFFIKKNK